MPTFAEIAQPVDVRNTGATFFREFLEEAAKGDVSSSHCIAAVAVGLSLISELDRIRQVTDDMVALAQQAYSTATGDDLEARLARVILQAALTPRGALSTDELV